MGSLGLLGVGAAFALTAGAAAFAFRPDNAGSPMFVAAILVPSAILAAAGLFKAHRDDELASWIKPRWGDFSGGAVTAALLFAVAYGVGKVLAPDGTPRAAWLFRLYLHLGPPEMIRQKASLVGLLLALFAVTDAIVWRGMVPGLLAERFGSRTAWIGSGLLYGLAYAPAAFVLREHGAGPNLVLAVTALATGLILAANARFFRRLVPGMIAHVLFAWFSLMTFRLSIPSI